MALRRSGDRMLAAMSVSPGLTGAHLPAVVVIFCRGLEQYDNPPVFQDDRVQATHAVHTGCRGWAVRAATLSAKLATCPARNPAAAPATTGPSRQLTQGPDTGKKAACSLSSSQTHTADTQRGNRGTASHPFGRNVTRAESAFGVPASAERPRPRSHSVADRQPSAGCNHREPVRYTRSPGASGSRGTSRRSALYVGHSICPAACSALAPSERGPPGS